MVERFVSGPIELAAGIRSGDYERADLIFDDVDHSSASYEAQLFFNLPDAGVATGRDNPAYGGSFHVFGHGGCFGDLGHCVVPSGPRDPFDLRAPHQLTPVTKDVIVTDALRRVVTAAPSAAQLVVTVVCVAPGKPDNSYLRFSGMRLLVYR
jgi:hypothetical protein